MYKEGAKSKRVAGLLGVKILYMYSFIADIQAQ